MIRFENLSKTYWVRNRHKVVIDNLNLTLPTGKSLGLLGRNGAGKSTLLQIISGAQKPTTGRVLTDGSISWPVGLASSFHKDMTGAQNVRFVARIYGVDSDELVEFVRHFAELGDHFFMPFSTYSSGMRSRITFGTVMGIRFDTYLVDEVTSVGDASFRRKSRAVFLDRVKNASAIMVSHNMGELRDFCDAGVVLNDGKIEYFDDIEDAIEVHEKRMAQS
ncbi:ABC transporter ATP-binding protein [Maritimibacter dapengensis]|uniref:ABC transporter ATP-binding protein n=1 Tax=Maritimibacter dapengensis TaxID=2836868 RepID=A0ABS6T4M4_9RHOB|nr:ABC transporter ATP-binding protein [Maritimibacter dapengensis]MBV7380179.1 ABC transporter ATP-binding protein [Maritimibacter dapengensis]